MNVRTAPAALLLVLAACSGAEDEAAGKAPAARPRAASAPAAPGWAVTPDGAGPVRVGMTLAEARQALGGRLQEPRVMNLNCDYVRPEGGPPGLSFMVVGRRVARVDVDSAGVATAEGAALGDAEPRIQEMYPGRVEVQPHQYTEGKYLVVTPADTTRRIVFETDAGGRVVRYHAGRMPAVQWVEKCS